MDEEFLKKEEEYRKENHKLEQKTKELMRKVDDMIINKIPETRCLDMKLKPIEAKDLNLPKSVDEMGPKGMIHFYKSQLKTLQNHLDKTQTELKHRNEEVKRLQKSIQNHADEKEKWFLQYNGEKNNGIKLEKQLTVCHTKIQLKDSESQVLRKEVEQLKGQLKSSRNELSSVENRLKGALQEGEKHKGLLKTLRQDEKESKDAYRHNLKELTITVKQIQKHRNELLHGYKKQIQLIDNLKKQKATIESCRVLELAEGEFFKLLDWKIE